MGVVAATTLYREGVDVGGPWTFRRSNETAIDVE
jgi:hypothetical protein